MTNSVRRYNNVFLMLASNDLPTRDALKQCLMRAGYRKIMIAITEQDILDRLSSYTIDLLILGPDFIKADNGWRLIRLVRSGRFCATNLPIIILDDTQQIFLNELQAKRQDVLVLPYTAYDQLPRAISHFTETIEQAKSTVLVIEDDENAAQLAKLSLQRYFIVDVAYDGETGLGAWKTTKHTLVLLDVQLPKLSGFDVLKQIRADNPLQPIIIITAYATQERHRDLMLAGAAEFVSKPFDIRKLQKLCHQILEHYAYLQHHIDQIDEDFAHHLINNHLWAANQCLSRGQAAMAAYHVKNALAVSAKKNVAEELTDDDWMQLMTDYDCP